MAELFDEPDIADRTPLASPFGMGRHASIWR